MGEGAGEEEVFPEEEEDEKAADWALVGGDIFVESDGVVGAEEH